MRVGAGPHGISAYLHSTPFVAVMQATNLRNLHHRSNLRRLHGAGAGSILAQRQMSARFLIILKVDVLQEPFRLLYHPTIMAERPIFKWRHFAPEIILCAVRWYLRYSLSYRELQELSRSAIFWVDHTTVWRWVQINSAEQRFRVPGIAAQGGQ